MDMEAAVVMSRIKDTIGLTTRVIIEAPGAVERSLGKARRLVDRRPKD
jgi:phenylacetate-CoA ligase